MHQIERRFDKGKHLSISVLMCSSNLSQNTGDPETVKQVRELYNL